MFETCVYTNYFELILLCPEWVLESIPFQCFYFFEINNWCHLCTDFQIVKSDNEKYHMRVWCMSCLFLCCITLSLNFSISSWWLLHFFEIQTYWWFQNNLHNRIILPCISSRIEKVVILRLFCWIISRINRKIFTNGFCLLCHKQLSKCSHCSITK